MNKLSYKEQSRQLIIAIDIAIVAFQLYSPEIWDDNTKQHGINVHYLGKIVLKTENLNLKTKKVKVFIK